MPTVLKSLRSLPWHSGHSVSDASLNDCCTSKRCPHAVHA